MLSLTCALFTTPFDDEMKPGALSVLLARENQGIAFNQHFSVGMPGQSFLLGILLGMFEAISSSREG